MTEALIKTFLDYGALGVSFGLVIVIMLHQTRLQGEAMKIIKDNAVAQDRMAEAVEALTEAVWAVIPKNGKGHG